MIKALLMIFDPIATWDGIARTRRPWPVIFLMHCLPLLLLSAAIEYYGLSHWGKWQSGIPRLKVFTHGEALIFEAGQLVLSIGVIFMGAKVIKALGETFHGRHTFAETFTVAAYGLAPVFLFRAADAFSGVSPWVTFSIGILLTTATLYHGLPRVMNPDPPHAFGLFLMSSLMLLLISGLARFVTACYLVGQFTKVESMVNHLADKLHL